MDKPALNLHSTMDAQVWAEEFNNVLVKKGEQPFDPGFLIGWFSNAIMCGYDHAKQESRKVDVGEIEEVILRSALNVEARTSLLKLLGSMRDGKRLDYPDIDKMNREQVEELAKVIAERIK